MHQIAAENRVILAAAEREGGMARRMAGRGQDARVVADLIFVAHDLGPVGLDDRQHAVNECRHRGLGVLFGPVIELVSPEHVACVRERRHPAAVVQPRVPADMIDMQMRAHDIVDVAKRKSRCGKRARVNVVGLHVPFRTQRPRLVVADAAVDQDGVVRRLHDVGLEAQDQRVAVVDRLRLSHP